MKNKLILALIGSQFFCTPTLNASTSYECLREMGEVTLLRRASEKIIASNDLSQIAAIKEEMSFDLGEFQMELIKEDFKGKLAKLNDEIGELEVCGAKTACVVAQAKKLLLQVNTLRRVISSSMLAENKTKKLLHLEAESIADQMADKVFTAREIRDGIHGKIESRRSIPNFHQIYVDTFSSLRQLATRPTVRMNYLTNLSITLSGQLAGQIIHLGQSISLHGLAQGAWIYPNTTIMMALQEGVGGEETPEIIRPFTTFDQAIEALPEFIHGKAGFSTDFKNKFSKLFRIITIEFPISLMLRILNDKLIPLAGIAPHNVSGWVSLLSTQAVIIGAIYTVFSFKWAAWDKWAYLNFLPNLKRGHENEFQLRLYQELMSRNAFSADYTLGQFKNSLAEDPTQLKRYESVFKHSKSDPVSFSPVVAKAFEDKQLAKYSGIIYRGVNEVTSGVAVFFLVDWINQHAASIFGTVQ